MVKGPAAVLAGEADGNFVLEREVSIWRDIAQRFNEYVDLKVGSLFDVRISLFNVDGTPRDRIHFDVEAVLDKGRFVVEFSIDNSGTWISNVDPVCLSNHSGWKQIGKLIENLDDIQKWLASEVA